MCCLQDTYFGLKDTHRLKVKNQESLHTNWKKKERAGIAILTSGKTDLKSKTVTRDKEGHYIMTKGWIHQKYVSYKHMCT